MSYPWVQNLKTSRSIHVQAGLKKNEKTSAIDISYSESCNFIQPSSTTKLLYGKTSWKDTLVTIELQSAAFFWTRFLFPYFFIFIFVPKSFFVSLAPSFVHLSFLTSVYLFVYKSVRVFVCLFVVWLTFSSFIDSFLCCCLFWLKMHFALGLQSYDVSWTTAAVNTFILQFDYWLIFIDIS